jgi:hypothetical protein
MEPLRPADPTATIKDVPMQGQVEVSGVRLIVQADDWRSWPEAVQAYLTPIEVKIDNHSGKALRIRHQQYGLTLPNGRQFTALSAAAVEGKWRMICDFGRCAEAQGVYPYVWLGLRGPGAAYPSVNFVGPDPRPVPEGTIEPGGYASVMLFFDVPADQVNAFTFWADLEDDAGVKLGTRRLAFTR